MGHEFSLFLQYGVFRVKRWRFTRWVLNCHTKKKTLGLVQGLKYHFTHKHTGFQWEWLFIFIFIFYLFLVALSCSGREHSG